MADVSHELGSLRFVVESPLSSKVAMFNNQVQQHQQAQLLNPFSNSNNGRSSPKPTFSKEEYGKPLAGSLTEMRGQKANIHVLKDMLELCQIINSEGYQVKDQPTMRVIPFGELFNIYNFINDKVVGILLRARKHKLVEFEGEMLFQRRDDDVPIFLLKPIKQIREELDVKIETIKRASSPAPQATTLLLDKASHQKKLQDAGLATPKKQMSRSPSPSRHTKTQTPVGSKAPSPVPATIATTATPAPAETSAEVKKTEIEGPDQAQSIEKVEGEEPRTNGIEVAIEAVVKEEVTAEKPVESPVEMHEVKRDETTETPQMETATAIGVAIEQLIAGPQPQQAEDSSIKTDINNNTNNADNGTEVPTIVIDETGADDVPPSNPVTEAEAASVTAAATTTETSEEPTTTVAEKVTSIEQALSAVVSNNEEPAV